jgi:hypothetical protein
MKHWPFCIAILLLVFLLLPIYEGVTDSVSIDSVSRENDMLRIKTQVENNKQQIDNIETKTNYIMSYPGSTTELATGNYAIKNGKYCKDTGTVFECNEDKVVDYAKTQIINLGGGFYNLKGGKNNKFCADDFFLSCNKDAAGPWENTQIVNLGGGNYNIKGGKNRKYCHSEGTMIICNKDMPTNSTTFQISPI